LRVHSVLPSRKEHRDDVRTSTATTSSLVYFLSDHLGSTSITVNPDGSKIAEMRYTACPTGVLR
jgi:hypothetical protein